MSTITQKNLHFLPDFSNLGIMLRILLLVNAMAATAAVIQSSDWSTVWQHYIELAALIQPILLLSLIVLYLLSPLLKKIAYFYSVLAVAVIELVLTSLVFAAEKELFLLEGVIAWQRCWFFTLLTTTVVLFYFDLRNRALSPALLEARLQALQARIRPHFLFNSINAVLSLIRSEPKRAERVIENLADLFRVIMSDNRKLSTLQRETELAQQYLEIEALRLGDRLQVEWHIGNMPKQAQIPPLILQPLLENAVYHGIEPAIEAGLISITIYRSRDEVHLVIRNPYRHEGDHHAGNKMALGNIRERLELHFDAEASVKTTIGSNFYQIHLTFPYLEQETP